MTARRHLPAPEEAELDMTPMLDIVFIMLIFFIVTTSFVKESGVAVSSVRYDDAIPALVRDRLEEVAHTINMVASLFSGDVNKTVAWFRARNPILGDISPGDMIRLGRYERLRKFIINGMRERSAKPMDS